MTSTETTVRVKCGNCGHYHESAAAVRKCYQGRVGAPATVVADRQAAHTTAGATAKQLSFLRTLFTERGRSSEWITNRCHGLTVATASTLIGETLKTPKAAPVTTTTSPAVPVVPAGRYAIIIDGETKFFRVDRPTEGTWKGRTFVKIQASDTLYPVKGSTAHRVLELIAVDPKAAMLRYGIELGHCGHCGRTLTNEESRSYGIGPICRGHMGW